MHSDLEVSRCQKDECFCHLLVCYIVIDVFLRIFNFKTSTLNLEIKQKIHWDWPAVSEAIRGRPGYIIYYKLDKYKEIRLYISIYSLH